jgi:hypothetical protein
MVNRLAIVEEQLRACLADHGPKEGSNPDKRSRTEPVKSSDPPAAAGSFSTNSHTNTICFHVRLHWHARRHHSIRRSSPTNVTSAGTRHYRCPRKAFQQPNPSNHRSVTKTRNWSFDQRRPIQLQGRNPGQQPCGAVHGSVSPPEWSGASDRYAPHSRSR